MLACCESRFLTIYRNTELLRLPHVRARPDEWLGQANNAATCHGAFMLPRYVGISPKLKTFGPILFEVEYGTFPLQRNKIPQNVLSWDYLKSQHFLFRSLN